MGSSSYPPCKTAQYLAILGWQVFHQPRKSVTFDAFEAQAFRIRRWTAHIVSSISHSLVGGNISDEAIAEFQRAIALGGHSGAFDYNLAYVDAVTGRKDEALKIVGGLEVPHDQTLLPTPMSR